MKDLVQEILKRTSILFVILGVGLLIIGATDHIALGSFSLQISNAIWKTIIGVVGLIFIGLGIYSSLREPVQSNKLPSPKKLNAIKANEQKDNFVGTYRINEDPNSLVFIYNLFENQYRLESPIHWDAVGIFDGKTYFGVFRYKDTIRDTRFKGVWGVHKATWRTDGSIAVHGTNMINRTGEWDLVLNKIR